MDFALLFGVLLTLFPLITIHKLKEESTFQRVIHIGCLLVGLILLVGFSIQLSTFIDKY